MKEFVLIIMPLAVLLCLLLSASVQAQNTVAYSTIDYDAESNKIYGYAYTEPDYSSGIYYQIAYVGGKLRDASHNELAAGSKQNYGRAEMYLEADGNGNGPYKIQTGHYVFLSYYVNNYWDSYSGQYRTGYLDYYYYNYYFSPSGGGFPTFDIPWFFDFLGRNPPTVVPSINMLLGTLLSEFLPTMDSVTFKTAKVDSTSRSFNLLNNAELPLGDTSGGSGYCFGSASNPFTLILDFDLPADTSNVFTDSRSFMSEDSAKDQFSRVSALQFTNIDLSGTPKKGRVSVSMFRKRPSENFSNNRVRITVAGRISGGGSFSTTGRVRLTCP